MSQTKSPFKFLDSYQQDDADVYFGRKNETRDLYKALQGVKHLLVFGPSGSGKTSLIECGLRNQFSEAAWFALSVRRGQNIVQSVFARINEVLAEKLPLDAATQLPANPDFGFGQAVERLFAERYQPVYLLFDQFEELLLLGAEDEKRDFFTRLQQLIEYKTPCRVLLVMREEFIGHLSEWEAICPSIFQHRFRLEKMGRSNVQTVIQQILEADKYKSQFQTQQPEMLAAAILSKLPDTQLEIELAHVQVFLDELWHRAAGQTDPGEQPLLQSNLVRKDDDLERILDSFLKKQLRELAPVHGDKLPLELLATLITERHTKLQASPAGMEAALAKNGVTFTQPLADLLRDLEQRRILRSLKVGEQTQYEISHDVLARVVGGNLTEEMKLRERAREVYRVYEERKGLFSREDLELLRPYEAYLGELRGRMRESETELREREKEKLEMTKRRLRTVGGLLGVALIGVVAAIFFGRNATLQKNEATLAARRAYANDLAYKSQVALERGDRTAAFRLAEFAHWYADSNNFNVIQSLANALYCNDQPFNQPLPWAMNLLSSVNIAESFSPDGINSLDFSPDGKMLCAGYSDNTAKIWDLSNNSLAMVLEGHTGYISWVDFSPDSKRIATASSDSTVKIWNIDAKNGKLGKEILTIKGHKEGVRCVEFSPDSKSIATASSDGTTRIVNLDEHKGTIGTEILILKGDAVGNKVAFSPDGKMVATTGLITKYAKIWNLDAKNGKVGSELARLKGHLDYVNSIAFSSNNDYVATASDDHTAKIYNLNLKKGRIGDEVTTLTGHVDEVESVAFSPDGNRIVTCSDDYTAKVWSLDWQRDKPAVELHTLVGHSYIVTSAVFSPDNQKVATASYDNTIRIWDLSQQKRGLGPHSVSLRGHRYLESVAFSPDGSSVATGAFDTVRIWKIEQDQESNIKIETNRILQGSFSEIIFSPDGKHLAITSRLDSIEILNINSEKEKFGLSLMKLFDHKSSVYCIDFSPDGKFLAAGFSDKMVKVWNLETQRVVFTIKEFSDIVKDIAFAPDGKSIATISNDGLKIWRLDLKNERLDSLLVTIGNSSIMTSVDFAPDSKSIATGSYDNIAQIWNLDAKKGKIGFQIMSLLGHSNTVWDVDFSPDGKSIATVAADQTVKIWNLDFERGVPGAIILSIKGHSSSVENVSFSADGKRVITGSLDGYAKIWEISAEGCINAANEGKHIAILTVSQLVKYGLENLLDQAPGNDSRLLATGNAWQIAAFAELYSIKIINGIP